MLSLGLSVLRFSMVSSKWRASICRTENTLNWVNEPQQMGIFLVKVCQTHIDMLMVSYTGVLKGCGHEQKY